MAHDGVEAIVVAKKFQPSLVLLDIDLPGMNGCRVAEELRKTPKTRDVILATLTGYGAEQGRQRSMPVGFDHHPVRPVPFDERRNLLRSLSPRS